MITSAISSARETTANFWKSAALQGRLVGLWPSISTSSDEPKTIVVVPSLTLDIPPEVAPLVPAYEERFLFMLLLLKQQQARVVLVSSTSVAAVPPTTGYGIWDGRRRRPWADLVDPALTLAADGFPVSPHLSQQMAVHAHRLGLYPESADTYLIGGLAPHPPGSILEQPGYAASLETIADGGRKAFYRGPIAQAIVDSMSSSGGKPGDQGFMTLADLKNY